MENEQFEQKTLLFDGISIELSNHGINFITIENTTFSIHDIPASGVIECQRNGDIIGIICRTHPELNRFQEQDYNYKPSIFETMMISNRKTGVAILLPLTINLSNVDSVPIFITTRRNNNFILSAQNVNVTNDKLLYIAQIFGHTTGWAPAILSAMKQTGIENKFVAGMKPGKDAQRFQTKATHILGRTANKVDLFYNDRSTTNITSDFVINIDISELLNPEVALLWIGQNMELTLTALESGIIFNDMRDEIGIIDMLFKGHGIRESKLVIANRYAFREFSKLLQLRDQNRYGLISESVLSRILTAIDLSIFSDEELHSFAITFGLDIEKLTSANFAFSTEKKLANCGEPTIMLYQALNWQSLIAELESRDPRIICIPPIATESDLSPSVAAKKISCILEDINPNLKGIFNTTDTRNVIVVSQGTGIATNRQTNWEALIHVAQQMPESQFIFIGVEEKVQFTNDMERESLQNIITSQGLQNLTLIGWTDGWYIDLIKAISNKPKACFVCRPGLSSVGVAIANGVIPLMMSPDQLPQVGEQNRFKIEVAPEVAMERALYFLEMFGFLKSLGFKNDNMPPILLNTIDITDIRDVLHNALDTEKQKIRKKLFNTGQNTFTFISQLLTDILSGKITISDIRAMRNIFFQL